MLIDKTSEIVAHFIGVFEMTTDGSRLRTEIDAFRHKPDQDLKFEDLSPLTTLSRAPYALEGYAPGLTPFWFSPEAQMPIPLNNLHVPAPFRFHGPKKNPNIENQNDPEMSGFGTQSIGVMSRAPDTAVIVSHQANYLVDHDFYGDIDSAIFVSPKVLDQQLDALWDNAQVIMPAAMGNPVALVAEPSSMGETLKNGFLATATAAQAMGATATFLSGADVAHVTVNGVAQDDMPNLGDALPVYLQDKNEAAATQDDSAVETFPAASGNAASAASYFDVDDGHNIVAGGNMAINETSIVALHVDAPVIAVMGDVTAVSLISQVNVIRDHNSGATNLSPDNTSINAAMFAATHSLTPETPASFAYPPDVTVFVTQVDADFISVNWMHQYNYMSDHDTAQITFSGEDTFLDFGDNVLFNNASILEFTQGYDLIFIGGDMYDLSSIVQTNLLFDDDTVSLAGAGPYTASMSDNLVYNTASIQSSSIDTYVTMDDIFAQMGGDLAGGATTLSDQVQNHDVFDGHIPLNVLYISGNFMNISAIEQTNIVGDADQIQLEIDALLAQSDAIVTTTTGSNAGVNLASIHNYGVDSTIMVGGEVYDDLLLYQAELIDTDAQPLGAAPLATEAVAFLADDMIDPGYGDTETLPQAFDITSSDVDMMGSIVT